MRSTTTTTITTAATSTTSTTATTMTTTTAATTRLETKKWRRPTWKPGVYDPFAKIPEIDVKDYFFPISSLRSESRQDGSYFPIV